MLGVEYHTREQISFQIAEGVGLLAVFVNKDFVKQLFFLQMAFVWWKRFKAYSPYLILH